MNNILSLASLCLVASIVPLSAASTVIYTENFSSTTITNSYAGFIGGNQGSNVAFNTWVGSTEASITTGALRVAPSGGTRSGGIILSHETFAATGAGSYTLSFDVSAYSGNPANKGMVTIWSGSGYTYGNSVNALELAFSSASLVGRGSATASPLGSTTIANTDAGTRKSITFNYDGTSEVALFFGMTATDWVHPVVNYDNIEISHNAPVPVPEPSVTALAAGMVGAMCLIRRRKARMNG
ncbi:MAG: hypothetical protein EOP88_17565 [Verrucomicrobiaceae bacterium]|nr:MAG: hypothetical protein EOP88_17565 [Verrucomicrobiaceae bacterium]